MKMRIKNITVLLFFCVTAIACHRKNTGKTVIPVYSGAIRITCNDPIENIVYVGLDTTKNQPIVVEDFGHREVKVFRDTIHLTYHESNDTRHKLENIKVLSKGLHGKLFTGGIAILEFDEISKKVDLNEDLKNEKITFSREGGDLIIKIYSKKKEAWLVWQKIVLPGFIDEILSDLGEMEEHQEEYYGLILNTLYFDFVQVQNGYPVIDIQHVLEYRDRNIEMHTLLFGYGEGTENQQKIKSLGSVSN